MRREPWKTHEQAISALPAERTIYIVDANGCRLAEVPVFKREAFDANKLSACRANAHRIVACVNALAGISTPVLEALGTLLGDLVKRLVSAHGDRDSVEAALARLWLYCHPPEQTTGAADSSAASPPIAPD